MKYHIKVNDLYEFDFDESEIAEFDASTSSATEFHIIENHRNIKAKVVDSDFNHRKYTVEINGKNFDVAIQNELDQLVKKMGFETNSAQLVNVIKAPMPGLILEINVEVGAEVKTGETLLVLGAMKMENSFASPRDGVIKSVLVNKDDAVEKGQLLIEFE